MPHVIRAVVLAIAGVAVVGCNWPPTSGTSSSSGAPATNAPTGDPPVLESADMTAAVAPSNGVYTIFGSLTYTCDDDVVHTIRITVPVVGKSYDYAAGDLANAYGTPFTFTLVDDIPFAGAGDTNYEIILITKGGAESSPLEKTVTLQ